MRLRSATVLVCFCAALVGCDDDRATRDAGGGPGRDGAAGTECFCCTGGFVVGSLAECAALCEAMCPDSGPGGTDGGATASDAGGDMGVARVNVTFSGCPADLSGDLVVVRNAESIAVSSTSGGTLTGSVQLALQDQRGTVALSTRHRIDTGAVVNVVATTTWTNIARDSAAVLGGTATDPIGGTLNVRAYDEAAGVVDVEFSGVTLQNPSDDSICRLDGRLETFRLSF